MSTRIFNLTKNSPPIPGPVFLHARDTKGLSTGRHTFTAVKGSMEMPSNQARFKKGTPVTSLDPSISSTMSHLTLDDFDVQTIPGGYEEISANFSGYSESGDFEFDREVTYSSNNTLVEKSMLENPFYRAAVESPLERYAFAQVYNGMAHGEASFNSEGLTSVLIKNNVTEAEIVTITSANYLKWYDRIFVKDERTYMVPTFEWTKSTSNAGGLSKADLARLGKIDPSPPGNPPEPPDDGPDYTWIKSGANDVRGEGSASTEETWSWGYYPDDVYYYESVST